MKVFTWISVVGKPNPKIPNWFQDFTYIDLSASELLDKILELLNFGFTVCLNQYDDYISLDVRWKNL